MFKFLFNTQRQDKSLFMKNIWKKIKSTYYKALNEIKNDSNYNTRSDIQLRTFAGCVAMLCHDKISLPMHIRAQYLLKLANLTGGPTVREHYCMWQAFGRGDAVRNMDNELEITQFTIDQRFSKPGDWSYSEAYAFCLEHVFAPIGKQHKFISQIEECIDDDPDDINSLNNIID